MAGKFDPYHTWLSIAPEEQPPTLYRLLGVRPFEDNLDVIETAADRQMTYLRTFQSGKRSEDSQRLLNQVASAKVNLLKPEKKAEYDRLLREQMDLEEEGSEPDKELSTTLAGFLEAIEVIREEQAKAKKSLGRRPSLPDHANAGYDLLPVKIGSGCSPSFRQSASVYCSC